MTAASDPVLTSARHLVGEALTELRSSIEGLPVTALNWRPAGEQTNSIAVLAIHSLSSTHMWLSIAVGEPLPDRDRASEFTVSTHDSAELLDFVGRTTDICLSLVDDSRTVDWSAPRKTHGRGGDAPPEVSAAFALIHATEHLRGHVDQISLTRQIWEQRNQA